MYKIKGKQELFDWVKEIKKLQNSVNVTWSGKTKTNSIVERAIKKIENRMMGKIELKGYKPKPSRKDMRIKREKIELEKDSEFERLALKEFNQF